MLSKLNGESTTSRKYWVVGGQYESLTFERLVQGTESVFGPFACRADAESTWRELSAKTRSQATVRFVIASEP